MGHCFKFFVYKIYLYLGTNLKGNKFFLLNLHILLSCHYPHFMDDEAEAKRIQCVNNLSYHTAEMEQS